MTPVLGYAAATAAGPVRAVNEDAVAAHGTILSGERAGLEGIVDPQVDTVFVVADGMGGHPCGGLASNLVVTGLAADPPEPTEASCAAAVRRANLQLHMAMTQQPETLGMGAVLAGLVLRGTRSCWFNVGDSRVYHSLADGRLVQLSIDDVCAGGPVGGKLPRLSAAVGGRRTIAPIEPHTGSTVLATGERLVLCSDGVTATLGDAAIAAIVHAAATLSGAVQDLLDACHRAGARDNISVVVVG